MIVSVNWLKKFTRIDRPVDELAELIGARLVEIEEIIDLGERYKEVTVAKVMKVEKHPDADKLHVVQIDDGGAQKEVERLENGYIQVVCGAPNVREGLLVAWLPPGATVPSSFTEKELFILDARKLRGVLSNGMLASARELGFSDNHEGILEIDVEAKPGESFAKLYDLDDYLLDIENKSLTHRPDCFGLVGFAREVAAIQGQQFTTPDWLKLLEPAYGDKTNSTDIKTPTVKIENPEICARYQVVAIANVDAKRSSPLQLQSYLSRVGMRPISAVVDITNYLMLLTGQPTHAFDYDKFVGVSSTSAPDITVREGREGEKLKLLDGREIALSNEDILICAGDTPVGLAGAMGGSSTEVDETTRNILLESATFDLYRLRTTQMRHGIFSEAITRFTKGQPAPQTAPVLAEAVRLFSELAGGTRATEVVGEYPGEQAQPTLAVSEKDVNDLLGSQLDMASITDTLEHVEFMVDATSSGEMKVTPPYWRADIHILEDIIEEIGRITGFDEIAPVLPYRSAKAVQPHLFDHYLSQLRQRMVRAGANELLTYSFVHGDMLQKAGQSTDEAFKITNAISPDLQYYRLTLIPSLLDKVYSNIRQRFEDFALFEINKVHSKRFMTDDNGEVPNERTLLSAVVAASEKAAKDRQTAYYEAKKLCEFAFASTNVALEFYPFDENWQANGDDWQQAAATIAPFERKRSAAVYAGTNAVGIVGEFKKSVTKSFKLPQHTAGFEIDARGVLMAEPSRVANYQPLSRFPGTEQDICIQVTPETTYADVTRVAKSALTDETIEWHIAPVDIYEPPDAQYKNITLRVTMVNHERTITTDEASIKMAYIAEAAREQLMAKIV